MKKTLSALYAGSVMHLRLRPRRHRLNYSIFQLLLDLDEIDALDGSLRLFSRNRFNLFSFHDRDHGDRSGGNLRCHVERALGAAGIRPASGRIALLTMPRILGYVFNPLSVYFCYDRGGSLHAILYEVANTFGGRHDYAFQVGRPCEDGWLEHGCDKRFFVSPFMDMDLGYAFRVRPPEEGFNLSIMVGDAEGPMLSTVQTAERRTLSDATLAGVALAYPLMTLKVIAGIHWEAVRLWVKGLRLRPIPRNPKPRAAAEGGVGQAVPEQ